MDIVIWTYIFGGATIFALIVGMFSVYNGRMTRRELGAVIERGNERTQSLLERMNGRLEHINGHLEHVDNRIEHMNGHLERIDSRMEKLTETMEQLALHMQDMDKRHTELLTRIAEKAPQGTP